MTRSEVLGIVIILAVIGVAGFFNLNNSVLLARDVQRKNDLKHIGAALTDYTNRAGGYPKSRDGKIASCGENRDFPCRWGLDPLSASDSAIMERLPNDPSWQKGVSYLYHSDTRDFQLFAHLEREDDVEYNKNVVKGNLECGVNICNFGVGSGGLPVDNKLDDFLED